MMGMDLNGLSLDCTIFMSSIPSTSGIMMSVRMRSTSCSGEVSTSIACLPFIAVVTGEGGRESARRMVRLSSERGIIEGKPFVKRRTRLARDDGAQVTDT